MTRNEVCFGFNYRAAERTSPASDQVRLDVLIKEVVRTLFVGGVSGLFEVYLNPLADPRVGSLVPSVHLHKNVVDVRR
jgi:hypothetical protein